MVVVRDKNNSNKAVWSSADTVIAHKAYGIKSNWKWLANDYYSSKFTDAGPDVREWQQTMYIKPTSFENYKSEP
jgi:hypothetical protein